MTASAPRAVVLGICLLIGSPAGALTGEEILKKMDEVEFSAKDIVTEVKMILEENDGSTSERRMKVLQMGSDKRLIKFLSPADVKGIGFLDADDKMYVYMPAFHKIRRIAGHVKNENFAGTDFAYDDLNSEKFSERLVATSLKEEKDHYVLETRDKGAEDSRYSKLVFRIRKKDFMFDRVDYFDKSGSLWKVFIRKEFKQVGKYIQSYWAEMDDRKKHHKTRMIIESIRCDTGLKDRQFSKRQLKRH